MNCGQSIDHSDRTPSIQGCPKSPMGFHVWKREGVTHASNTHPWLRLPLQEGEKLVLLKNLAGGTAPAVVIMQLLKKGAALKGWFVKTIDLSSQRVVGLRLFVVTSHRILEVERSLDQDGSSQLIRAFNLEDVSSMSWRESLTSEQVGAKIRAGFTLSDLNRIRGYWWGYMDVQDKFTGRHEFGFARETVLWKKTNSQIPLHLWRPWSLVPIINDNILKRKAMIQKQQTKIVVIDFSWVRRYLDKGGLVLTAFKCPQCSGSIDLPKEGNVTKCKYCGSNVYAQDVFDKLKGLLSK